MVTVVIRAVPDLLFQKPAGAGFAGFLMANPAGARAGAGFSP